MLQIFKFICHSVNTAEWIINTSTVKLGIHTPSSCMLPNRWKKLMQKNVIHWTYSGLRTDHLSSSQPYQDLVTKFGTESEETPSAILYLSEALFTPEYSGKGSEQIGFQSGVQMH